MKIYDNLHNGDCGLWYDVIALSKGKLIHHVCPYSKCSSYNDAIQYYFNNYFRENDKPIHVQHHKISLADQNQLRICC